MEWTKTTDPRHGGRAVEVAVSNIDRTVRGFSVGKTESRWRLEVVLPHRSHYIRFATKRAAVEFVYAYAPNWDAELEPFGPMRDRYDVRGGGPGWVQSAPSWLPVAVDAAGLAGDFAMQLSAHRLAAAQRERVEADNRAADAAVEYVRAFMAAEGITELRCDISRSYSVDHPMNECVEAWDELADAIGMVPTKYFRYVSGQSYDYVLSFDAEAAVAS